MEVIFILVIAILASIVAGNTDPTKIIFNTPSENDLRDFFNKGE